MKTVQAGGTVLDAETGEVQELDVAVEGARIVEVGHGLRGDQYEPCGGNLIVPASSTATRT